jgi:hypothetical protein
MSPLCKVEMSPSDVMETTLEGGLGALTVSKRDLLRIEVLTEGLAGRRTVASCFITENALGCFLWSPLHHADVPIPFQPCSVYLVSELVKMLLGHMA